MNDTKILLVGDDSYEMYVKAFYNCFKENGYENVNLFATNQYMKSSGCIFEDFSLKVQNKLAFGQRINKINKYLLKYVNEMKPELVFLYSARLIYAETVKKMKNKGIAVFVYNNDDPFASYYPKYFWRHYRKSLKYADVGFVYRLKNIKDYQQCGCEKVELLRAYYIKERNYPMDTSKIEVPSVVFIGHNEDDERQEYIQALLEEKITVGVPKKAWSAFANDNEYLIKLDNSLENYNEILNASKIAIVFLSKINHDTYTRRCFEIPATKTMMLSVYTDDIASMFEPDKEAVYFSSKEDFVKQVKFYLEHDEKCEKIGQAGYKRLMQDGHEVKDRVEQIIKCFEKIK